MTRKICFDPHHENSSPCVGAGRVHDGPRDAGPLPQSQIDAFEKSRHLLTRQVFSSAAPRSIWETNPFAFSPWAGFALVACSNSALPQNDDGAGEPSSPDAGSPRPDAGTPSPQPDPAPAFQRQGIHAETPCGPDGFLPDLDSEFGVCANATTKVHHLFRWNPLASGAAVSVAALTYPPDQVLTLASGDVVITTHETPGLAWVDLASGSEEHLAFPDSLPFKGLSSSGREVTVVRPTLPKGLVEIDGQVFVATSNLDFTSNDYLPGTILALDPDTRQFEILPTSGYNPTSLAVSNGLLLAVSSGALDQQGRATTPAFLDVFDPHSHALLQSVPLGVNGAGVSGEMAISEDQGTLVLPTADNSGRLIVVNLEDLEVRTIDLQRQGISPVNGRIFFSQIQLSPDGRYAWLSNFNDGKTYMVDLASGRLMGSPVSSDDNLVDFLGLSDGLLRGRDLFVGKGPDILRLQYR
jgi:hypothetical protein